MIRPIQMSLTVTCALLAVVLNTNRASAQLAIAEDLLISLDAQQLADGPLDIWPNTGSTAGDFMIGDLDFDGPTVTTIDGFRSVLFDVEQSMEGPIAPDGIVDEDPTRSVEVWAFNEEVNGEDEPGPGEEVMVSWGKRGGPLGSMVQFNYGNHSNFGAVTHWGGSREDMSWTDNTNSVPGAPEAAVWHHLVYTYDGETTRAYADGELLNEEFLGSGSVNTHPDQPIRLGAAVQADESTLVLWATLAMAQVRIHDGVLTDEEVLQNFQAGILATPGGGNPVLRAGDADQDLDFDQIDLVQVQIAAKYLSGAAATWGEGDWDAAPGGTPGDPPAGNGLFDQLDIIAALTGGVYLAGPYAAIADGGVEGDGQTSIGYNSGTGQVWVDAPAGVELTSVNIDSAAGVFTGEAAQNLGGSFDNDADGNIFKATFGSSFGTTNFGNIAQTGLSKDFLLNDLTVVGSLNGGGDLGEVDLVYVPEPSSLVLILFACIAVWVRVRKNR